MSFVKLFGYSNIIIEHRDKVFLFHALRRFSVLLNTEENSFNDFIRHYCYKILVIIYLYPFVEYLEYFNFTVMFCCYSSSKILPTIPYCFSFPYPVSPSVKRCFLTTVSLLIPVMFVFLILEWGGRGGGRWGGGEGEKEEVTEGKINMEFKKQPNKNVSSCYYLVYPCLYLPAYSDGMVNIFLTYFLPVHLINILL